MFVCAISTESAPGLCLLHVWVSRSLAGGTDKDYGPGSWFPPFENREGWGSLTWNCPWDWSVMNLVELSLDWTAEAAVPT